MDSCSTPASAAAMHATSMPRTTRVTRTAHGNGASAPSIDGACARTTFAFMLFARPRRSLRTAPLSTHCTGLRGHAAGERDRRQRRAQRVAPYDYAYAGAVASHSCSQMPSPAARKAKAPDLRR
eukprot:2634484-Pleurochrysis_carterae.AAC.2